MEKGMLTLFCGKMGAGKSTKAARAAEECNAILLAEDEWLESLYPNQIGSLDDYVKYSNLLKPQIKKLVQSILVTGTHVVMDFPANTRDQRLWLKSIFMEVDAPHRLIFIDVADDVCLKQIEKRREEYPDRARTDTPEMFKAVTRYFNEPTDDEGFNMIRVSSNE